MHAWAWCMRYGDPASEHTWGPYEPTCVGDPVSEQAWGPGMSVRAWAQYMHVWRPHKQARAGTLRANTCGTLQANVCGTLRANAHGTLRANVCGDLVHACVRGSIGHEHGCAGIQWARAWACMVDPAGTNMGVRGSSGHNIVIIPHASKHSVREKKGSLTLQGLCRARAWE